METSCKCSLPVNQGNSLRPWCFTSPETVWLIKDGERGLGVGGGGGVGYLRVARLSTATRKDRRDCQPPSEQRC